MADFYAKMQATSKRLIDKFAQGAVVYNEPGATTGDPWDPVEGSPVPHEVKAVQAPADRKKQYVDGGFIVATDILLAVAPFDTDPTLDGSMTINGEEHQIVFVDSPTVDPANPLAWFVGCRK